MRRDEYVANSLSRLRPWEALGMSWRTWYRWRTAKAELPKPLTEQWVCENAPDESSMLAAMRAMAATLRRDP
jgi:hypothetical protein